MGFSTRRVDKLVRQLGIEGIQEDADRVAITVVHAEIVSTVKTNELPTVALVPEKPERKTKSKIFFPAPIIIGNNYDISLRPHLEIPAPPGTIRGHAHSKHHFAESCTSTSM